VRGGKSVSCVDWHGKQKEHFKLKFTHLQESFDLFTQIPHIQFKQASNQYRSQLFFLYTYQHTFKHLYIFWISMFRVYSIFYLDKIWWTPSEQEKAVSNSSDTPTDQIRNLIPIDLARNCGEQSLPSSNNVVPIPPREQQEDGESKQNESQTICTCHRPDPKTNDEKLEIAHNSMKHNATPPRWSNLHHRQVSLNMSSKDILSPIITYTRTKNLSFSPRRLLNRAMSRAESVQSFSSSNGTNKSFFLENATKKRSFTKKLKRAFSFHQ
jgi:hypothetical protein